MTKYKHNIDGICSKLLSVNYQTELFGGLDKFKRTADGHYKACCPFHNDKTPSFYISGDTPVWRCHGCHEEGNWTQYLEKTENLNFYQALEKLAQAAEKNKTENMKTESRNSRPQIDFELLKDAMDFFRDQIKTSDAKETIDYLKGRGFSDEGIEGTGFGFYPGIIETVKFLNGKGYSKESLENTLKYIGDREEHRLVIPYHDSSGELTGIWGRLAKTNPFIKEKYLPFSTGAKKDFLFNLHKIKETSSILVVEGFFDALLSHQKGLEAVAVVGSSLTKKQLENLKGVGHITLAFDNDEAGIKGTEKAIELLLEKGIGSSVVEYPDDPDIKDPADWINKEGVESFKTSVSKAAAGINWRWERVKQKYNFDDADQKEKSFAEYENLIKKIPDEKRPEFTVELETMFPGRKETIQKMIENKEKTFQTAVSTQNRPSVLPLGEHLKRKFETESKREAEFLGYKLGNFSQICENSDGIQPGFYLLAAETSVGKTAMLTNLFIDLILSNKELKGVYFSLDDGRDVIINRLLGILSGINLNRIQRKNDSDDHKTLEKAYNTIIRLNESNRLDIKDLSEVWKIDQCKDVIVKNANRPLFVVIDGLYNLEIDGGAAIREMNIDRANQIKTLVDVYKIPVICSGELRKKPAGEGGKKPPAIHDIMETGKLAYNSNIVWLLYPKDVKKFSEEDEPVLTLEFAKNKLSHFRSKIELQFIRKNSKIVEL